jgi:predicted regulator of Ras-like GTPase activity (Roadblock/LC7/MglB family)
MNSVVKYEADTEKSICAEHIEKLLKDSTDIYGAIVASVDGFEIASQVRDDMSSRKLSAISSSLLALAVAVCSEGGVGECRDMVIDASEGRVFLMDIPSRKKLLLMVLCGNVAMLGKVFWSARNARESMSKDLEAHHTGG